MIKYYILAARLRTLPLSVSGIIVGSFLAAANGYFNWIICLLALCTTIGFQIISNFANDYGDGVKGTDNKDRIGPERAIQSGVISPAQMLKAIKIAIGITFVIALLLIYVAFGKENLLVSLTFFILGVLSIVAALKYTMGNKAYGYSGYGDLFVFLFFGILSVCGSYYLYSKALEFTIFLPAFTIGLLSVAVLNLNNLRDRASDIKSKKRTLVVKIGANAGKQYHYCLLILSLLCVVLYTVSKYQSPYQYLFLLAYLPLARHFVIVYRNKVPKLLDAELKVVALSTFLLAVLFGLGQLL